MRRVQKPLILLLLLALAVTGLGISPAAPRVEAAPQVFPDDEIAFIDTSTCVQIIDPVNPAGQTPFTWNSSPTCGFSDMAATDVNGDGVEEIIAIGSNTARLLVPRPPSGTTPFFVNQLISGFVYISAGAGDIIGGDNGRTELILQKTDSRSGFAMEVWQGNSTGTIWNRVWDEPFGAPWIRVGTGQYNGTGAEELILMRNGDNQIRILTNDFAPFQVLVSRTYDFDWLELAVGNVNNNNGPLAELATSRGGVGASLNSFLIFQFTPTNALADAPGGQGIYNPSWTGITLANVNGAGDDKEVFMIRDPQRDDGVSMIGLNYGGDTPWNSAWNNGIQLGRSLRSITSGDLDADGKDEIIVARLGSYRIWLEPDVSLTNTTGDLPAAFRDPIIIRTGNYDGSGLEPPVLNVDQTLLSFEMLRDGANPPTKTFQVLNSGGGGGIAYDVTKQTGQAWVSVTPFEGVTPTTHTVTINGAGLAPGTYEEKINVVARSTVSGSPRQVTVRLRVIATGPQLKVDPTSLSFSHSFGGVTPAAKSVTVTNIGDGGSQNYTVAITTADGGNWLRTNKTNGATNDTLLVSVEPSALRPGNYTGNIRINAGAITGSPVDIPVSLTITATGMVVTPASLLLRGDVGGPSPRGEVRIDQAVAGQGAIHWYAYAVPSGDWWSAQAAAGEQPLKVEAAAGELIVTAPDGSRTVLDTLPWVNLTPDNGLTPNIMQVTLDMNQAPIGGSRITILVDGGPNTPDRFQGVDVRVEINNGGAYLPLLLRQP